MTFSILISSKNRKEDLIFTLDKIKNLLQRKDTVCVVYDDGSTDGTSVAIQENFPEVVLLRNDISKGYMFCRNKMLRETKSEFAISLDDDAHFLSENPLEKIATHFSENPTCGLIAFRLFWSKVPPIHQESTEIVQVVKGFVGCGHVFRMKAWREIPEYPEWFVFYGEEDFAAYQMFKKDWQVHYLPSILVQHRVDMSARKTEADFILRLRRSLRSGWYLYFLFVPKRKIPGKFAYSIWAQLKNKVFKGDFKVLKSLLWALSDLIVAFPKIISQSNRLSMKEYEKYSKLPATKIFWKPEK